jgi:Panthothenate synthetase
MCIRDRSSRNVYLTKEQRVQALSLSRSLKKATDIIMKKEFNTIKIKAEMAMILSEVEIEYIAIVNRQFVSMDEVKIGNSIILVAVEIGQTRLIDNLWI